MAFKQAWVIPLLKKVSLNLSDMKNYRHVPFFPFYQGFLNRLVLSKFLISTQNNSLDSNQSGFKSGHSTDTALLSVTEALRVAKASTQSTVRLFSAAVDTINYKIPMSTLSVCVKYTVVFVLHPR